jgi:hypothetical protein
MFIERVKGEQCTEELLILEKKPENFSLKTCATD